MELFSLKEKVAIVTGGNQGIGFAIAEGLAAAGAAVVIANRREPEGRQAAEKLTADGFNAVSVPTDVSNVASIENLVSETIGKEVRSVTERSVIHGTKDLKDNPHPRLIVE